MQKTAKFELIIILQLNILDYLITADYFILIPIKQVYIF